MKHKVLIDETICGLDAAIGQPPPRPATDDEPFAGVHNDFATIFDESTLRNVEFPTGTKMQDMNICYLTAQGTGPVFLPLAVQVDSQALQFIAIRASRQATKQHQETRDTLQRLPLARR